MAPNTADLRPIVCPRCQLTLAHIKPKYKLQAALPSSHIVVVAEHTLLFDMNTILCPKCDLHVRFSANKNIATKIVAPDDNLLARL